MRDPSEFYTELAAALYAPLTGGITDALSFIDLVRKHG
jgi:hypothetical protein